MGVRLALGAAPRDLYRLVLGHGLGLTGLGLAFGLAGALAAGQAVESLLYETSALDPVAFIGMAVVLTTTAFIACLLPRDALRPRTRCRHCVQSKVPGE